MQEDLEQRTVSVSIQGQNCQGGLLRAAIAAVLKDGTGTHNAKSRAQQHEAADL